MNNDIMVKAPTLDEVSEALHKVLTLVGPHIGEIHDRMVVAAATNTDTSERDTLMLSAYICAYACLQQRGEI